MTTTPLPYLPYTEYGLSFFDEGGAHLCDVDGYTADQMQAYATQARADLESENQRLREVLRRAEEKLIELEHAVSGGDDEIYVEGVILSIRAALEKQP